MQMNMEKEPWFQSEKHRNLLMMGYKCDIELWFPEGEYAARVDAGNTVNILSSPKDNSPESLKKAFCLMTRNKLLEEIGKWNDLAVSVLAEEAVEGDFTVTLNELVEFLAKPQDAVVKEDSEGE